MFESTAMLLGKCLNGFKLPDHEALLQLQEHGFQKSWLPPGEFHKRFPLGSQVNKYESTTAWAYTQGSVFAYEMNKLMREHEWSSLFLAYGHCVKALYSYCEKMQALYGERKTLYRGLVSSWEQTLEEYEVAWICLDLTTTTASCSRLLFVSKYIRECYRIAEVC